MKRWSLDARNEEQTATPSGEVEESEALPRANGTSWHASGWASEEGARSWRPIVPPLNSKMKVAAIGLPGQRHLRHASWSWWVGKYECPLDVTRDISLVRHIIQERELRCRAIQA